MILREIGHRDLTQNVADDLVYAQDGIYDAEPIELIAVGSRFVRPRNAARGQSKGPIDRFDYVHHVDYFRAANQGCTHPLCRVPTR